MVQPFEDAVFPQAKGSVSCVVRSQFGYHIIYKQDERTVVEYKAARIAFRGAAERSNTDFVKTDLDGRFLDRASVTRDPNSGMPTVSLEFDEEGAKKFEDITARNIGKPVGIFLDGQILSAPNVNEKISGGRAVISGDFSLREASDLAKRLNAGALPVPIKLVSQQTVGATLGQASLDDSLRAGIFGLLAVALFMIIAFRFPGFLSVFSLLLYGTIVLAVFKLFNVTLTLAGMAGFILSIGIAVDANVLIFSRLREELASGRTLEASLRAAFDRAWPSIRDGNASTLITCLILILFSTGLVRGFALTLSIGIICSMFTSIFVTRNFLEICGGDWLEKNAKWLIGIPKEAFKIR
jgi:preprotein translocase subunit SecD